MFTEAVFAVSPPGPGWHALIALTVYTPSWVASFSELRVVFWVTALNPAGPLQLQVILVPPVLLAVKVKISLLQTGFGLAVAVRVVMA
jgi:hypothetical protein